MGVDTVQAAALFDLSGTVAAVTGGNGGLGRAIALGFAKAGAAVAILGRNEEKNRRVHAELEALGVPALALQLDVTERSALAPAMAEIEAKLGGIGVLVNNAGNVSVSGGVLREDPADWDSVIETHLNATFLLSKLAAASMKQRNRGKIINIASIYAFFGSSNSPSYAAAKGGMIQLTKSMAIELAKYNIQVNAIAPGWFETDMTAPVRELPMNEKIMARTPAGRWGQPDEIAGAAIFLASQASSFVTGSTIRVDGGLSAR